MQIGIVGLGKMGGNMARRLARGGARVTGFDRDRAARDALADEKGVECADGLAALCTQLPGERVILTMLPAGEPTEAALRVRGCASSTRASPAAYTGSRRAIA
jgi:6-phosphogluconate dehydrogenase